jgi:predicted nuclease with TOPRIM domain
MAKTARSARGKPSAPAGEALKRRKKQAGREAELMLAIEEAKKDLKKAQKKQSKAQTQMEAHSTSLHTLETRLAELRSQSLEPESVTPPDSTELEHQQEPSELESSMVRSNGEQLASLDQDRLGGIGALTDQAIALPHVEEGMGIATSSSETGTSTSTDEVPTPPIIEEATPSDVKYPKS